MSTKRGAAALLAPLAVLATAAALALPPAKNDCEATVSAKETHVEPKELVTTHTYTVDVTTLEHCATVRVALNTTERISKSQVAVYTTADEVHLRNGSISTILHYDMPNDHKMEQWEVKVTSCARCEP